jgi:ribonuclease HI
MASQECIGFLWYFFHPDIVFKEGANSLIEFERCNGKELDTQHIGSTNRGNKHTTWTPPPSGTIKVNWDASLNMKKGWIGLGMIARDSNRFCLGARSVTKQVNVDPKTAEVMAALFAMQFNKEVDFLNVIFESNTAQVVKDINSEPPYVSWVSHFIENIHLEMGCFKSVSFAYIPHDCNSATHILAKEVSNNNVDLCWLEETFVEC